VTTVGIVGLGRTGRSLVRALRGNPRIRLGAIRDPAEPEQLAYLLRYDTILGRFPEPLSLEGGHLRIGDERIRLLAGKDEDPVRWSDLGVETVLDASDQGSTREQLAGHLGRGARRVIVCGPAPEPADPPVVAGVTAEALHPETRLLSLGTPTLQCAAPALRILHDAFGVRRAVLTAIHSYTGAHHLADAPAEDLRRGRAAAANIIPQASRSVGMLHAILPELDGRISAFALNVPAYNASAVDLVCWHERDADVEGIRAAFRSAAGDSRWARSLEVTEDPIVSSDVARTNASAIFDSLATMALPGRVSKTLLWFDAGYSFARRAIELVERVAQESAA
jgi:glyceraldehyde 3-phosphate dehydrogenase (phosphorylating)